MNRPTIGYLALLLLAGSIGLLLLAPPKSGFETWAGGGLRVGLTLGALWLALPEIRRIPRWLYGASLLAALAIAWQPKLFVLVIGAALATALLRPRWRG